MDKASDSFAELLGDLRGTQKSIEKTAKWFAKHTICADSLIEVWRDHILGAATGQIKLVAFYLANHILQMIERKERKHISKLFALEVPTAVQHIIRNHPKLLDKIRKVLLVWKKRKVMASKTIRLLDNIMLDPDIELPKHITERKIQQAVSNFRMEDDAVTRSIDENFQMLLQEEEAMHSVSDHSILKERLECASSFRHPVNINSNVQNLEKYIQTIRSQISCGSQIIEVLNAQQQRSRDTTQRHKLELEQVALQREAIKGVLQQLAPKEKNPTSVAPSTVARDDDDDVLMDEPPLKKARESNDEDNETAIIPPDSTKTSFIPPPPPPSTTYSPFTPPGLPPSKSQVPIPVQTLPPPPSNTIAPVPSTLNDRPPSPPSVIEQLLMDQEAEEKRKEEELEKQQAERFAADPSSYLDMVVEDSPSEVNNEKENVKGTTSPGNAKLASDDFLDSLTEFL
eukprot:TRINITY_DN2369_c0_g1_i1.p1 TRINITY_DN2369_c0_g1~~TRINITY_DN2369_c0_g1_i1.p1  ORF type:complete len:475 (+),score=142.34 TRINITY_DN2369_c0_g1_i1:59-1426(+)